MKNILFSQLDPTQFDKKNGVVYGVAVCTQGPARGHGLTVDKTTLQQLYNAAQQKGDKIPVKLDHRSGIKEIAGYLTDFEIDGDKLRANWHLLKSQANFNHTWETLEKMHDVCGLSCSFTGEAEGDKARAKELISCDFVPHPATGNGLFSAKFDHDIENDNMKNEHDNDELDPAELLETIHELLTHIEHVEAQNEELTAMVHELCDHLDEESDEEDDDDNEALISEKGARSGPNDMSAISLKTYDFESAVENLQRTGLGAKEAHIEALKEFSRLKYHSLNL